jgi:hypothetical protein
MNDDLDRLIDEAACQMAQRDPSDALSSAVMERIAAPAAPFARRRQLWWSVAAVGALASLLILARPQETPSVGTLPKAQGSGIRAQGLKTEGSGLRAQEQIQDAGLKAQGLANPVATVAAGETEQIDDAITIESITPAPIEVERLEVTLVKAIAPIEIAPLEIEPLSLSND